MKKYLMMALVALAIASCSKEDDIFVAKPSMSNEQVEQIFYNSRWHTDGIYLDNWSFGTSKWPESYYTYYNYRKRDNLLRFYGTRQLQQTGDAYFIEDGAIHIAGLVDAHITSYDVFVTNGPDEFAEYLTLTPISINGDTVTVIEVKHNINRYSFPDTEQPKTIKLIRGYRDNIVNK